MPFIPLPNGMRAEIRMTLDGQQVEHVLHIIAGNAPNAEDCQNVADIIDDWMGDTYLALLSPDLTYRFTYVRSLADSEAPEASQDANGGVGTQVGDALPNNVSIAMALRTGFTGRSARGRVKLTGLTANDLASTNTLDPTRAVNFTSAWETLQTNLGGDGYVWSVASFYSDGAPRAIASALAITDILFVDLTLDSQRRRLPGRGT